MALLRGHNVRTQIASLHKAELRAATVRLRARQWLLGFDSMTVSAVFAAWLAVHEREAEERIPNEAEKSDQQTAQAHRCRMIKCTTRCDLPEASVNTPATAVHVVEPPTLPTPQLDFVEPPNGQWRKQEEIRRNSMKIVKVFGFSYGTCFNEWKQLARAHAAARGKLRPVVAERMVVGSALDTAVQGEKLLAEFTLVESLYETRVAAAERLLAFFVMLYHAVHPTSRLPFWQYHLDRSESRLRVASTPAPVGFVETLPTGPMGSNEMEFKSI
jgi:hypothetical protein